MTSNGASPSPGLPELRFVLNGRETAQKLQGGKKALVWVSSNGAITYEVARETSLLLTAKEPFSLPVRSDAQRRDRWLVLRKVSLEGSGSEIPTGRISFHAGDDAAVGEHRFLLDRVVGSGRVRVPDEASGFVVRVRVTGRGQLTRISIEAELAEEASSAAAWLEQGLGLAFDPSLPGRVERVEWSPFEVTVRGYVAADAENGGSVAVQLCLDGTVQSQVDTSDPLGEPRRLPFALGCVATREALEARLEVRVPSRGVALPLPRIVETAPANEIRIASPVQAPQADDLILGGLREIGRIVVRGWAVNADRIDDDPPLVLALDGTPFSVDRSRSRRPDIGARFDTHDFHGFRFELPPNLGSTEGFTVSVAPTTGVARIEETPKHVPSRITGVRTSVLPRPEYAACVTAMRVGARTSFIVVNRNGAALLQALLQSARDHEATAEWIVVDHASIDESRAVCAAAAASGLNVRFLAREANFNFSQSNNFGANAATGENLVFINNDIVLTEPLSDLIAAALADDAVGAVGLTLVDAVPPGLKGPAPVQHVGVFVDPRFEKDQFRPFEARPVPELRGSSTARVVPAVTGALCAMRRALFEAVGGFEETYFYGWEDVDLCIRLGLHHDRKTVWLGQRSAIHQRGFTRRGGTTFDPRRAANGTIFNARWGSRLRRTIRSEILSRPGFWHGHRPVVAFAIRRAVSEAAKPVAREAEDLAQDLARAWQRDMPVHVVFLHEEEWADLAEIDVVVSFASGFDPSRCSAVRPHLLAIACALDWPTAAPLEAYDHVWAGSSEEARTATARLGRAVREFRSPMVPSSETPVRIAIKSAAPEGEFGRHWGDGHFAQSLAFALRRLGYVVRVDASGHWTDPITITDDVVIVLRGREAFRPQPHQKAILWLISHPLDVAPSEMEAYDHVFVASASYAQTLAPLLSVPVEVLHQCTDRRHFHPDLDIRYVPRANALFVGNSRGVFRDSVRWMVEAGQSIAVYGRGWDTFVPPDVVKAPVVPNDLLGRFYAASDVVLCDHWSDMRRLGFISNRVFDVLACGTRILVDDVSGLSDLFGEDVGIYRDRAEFLARLDQGRSESSEAMRARGRRVAADHSFDARAAVIDTRLRALLR